MSGLLQVLRSRPAVVWLVLVLATSASWWVGADHGVADRRLAAVVLLAVAFAKVHLVGRHFMQLGSVATPLRRAFDAYVLVVGGVLVALVALL